MRCTFILSALMLACAACGGAEPDTNPLASQPTDAAILHLGADNTTGTPVKMDLSAIYIDRSGQRQTPPVYVAEPFEPGLRRTEVDVAKSRVGQVVEVYAQAWRQDAPELRGVMFLRLRLEAEQETCHVVVISANEGEPPVLGLGCSR